MAWFGSLPIPEGIHRIYVARSPSGKSYVGLTKATLSERKQGHVLAALASQNKSSRPCHFHRALLKYGADSFSWDVLEDNIEGRELANLRERFHVARLRSDDSCYGYNGTVGGDAGSLPNSEVRAKMSLSAKRRGVTARQLENLQLGRQVLHPQSPSLKALLLRVNTGRAASAETRALMSLAHSGKKHSTEHCRAKQLAQANPILRSDGRPFLSARSAGQLMGVRGDGVGKALRGQGTCLGYSFRRIALSEYAGFLQEWEAGQAATNLFIASEVTRGVS